jgi:hypothetical protein
MNQDFRDLVAEFNARQVEFPAFGAHALAAHGHVRATQDRGINVETGNRNPRSGLVRKKKSAEAHCPFDWLSAIEQPAKFELVIDLKTQSRSARCSHHASTESSDSLPRKESK